MLVANDCHTVRDKRVRDERVRDKRVRNKRVRDKRVRDGAQQEQGAHTLSLPLSSPDNVCPCVFACVYMCK